MLESNKISIPMEIENLETEIRVLKTRRDALIKNAGFNKAAIEEILRMRSPNRTLCQILRDLHAKVPPEDKLLIEEALLIAKKMDTRIVSFAGQGYAADWYKDGKFKG